ncbi:DUF2989 domain-containing protein [Aestuariibacter salexigens]|uniref:DUF2989 domain-containing protein n=1 Tax=Aestuariibacter salexigens TaxID=226010 RepID=UPI00146FA19E|nr:DUF2989 domain-containing protein [Aestuariibacter salexigens]
MLLTGCGGLFEKSVNEICAENPQMCDDLNPDGWCRAEKAKIIKHRFEHQETLTPRNTYDQLINFEHYKKCIEKASQIEHIKLREKEAGRIKGLLTAERELKRLSRNTCNSDSPYLLYYCASRFGNEDAMQKFLSFEQQGRLNSAELQIALASHQVKFDFHQALKTLHYALSLYTDDDDINTDVFSSFIGIYLKLGEVDKAYVWTKVAEAFEVDGLDAVQMEVMARQAGSNTDRLEDYADRIIDMLEDRQFNMAPL